MQCTVVDIMTMLAFCSSISLTNSELVYVFLETTCSKTNLNPFGNRGPGPKVVTEKRTQTTQGAQGILTHLRTEQDKKCSYYKSLAQHYVW